MSWVNGETRDEAGEEEEQDEEEEEEGWERDGRNSSSSLRDEKVQAKLKLVPAQIEIEVLCRSKWSTDSHTHREVVK